jgi:hypothetical protein
MSVAQLESDGLSIACLLFEQDWSVALSISHRFPCVITAGQSGREGRRPKDEALRHQLAVHLTLEGEEAQEFRQLLATLGKGWVGIPIWHDRLSGADWADRIYDAQRLIDLTTPAIVAHDAELDPEHIYAPLLVGHIDELPELPALSQRLVDFTFLLVEDSPWAFRMGINATGVAGTWPEELEPDWSSSPVDQPEKPLAFSQIGDQRERNIDNEEVAFRWGQEAPFSLIDRDGIRELLAFFVACEGPRRAFEQPWWLKPADPTAEAPSLTTARFAIDTLTLDYIAGGIATTKIRVLQVPWEIDGVDGEDPEQPARVFFYKFTHAIPDAQVFRFTNWPRPLARTADGTYQPGPFKHGRITETLDLRNNGLTLQSFNFTGNPLMLFRPDVLEAPLLLTVMETETWPIDPNAAVVRWSGEVRRPTFNGRRIEAPCVFLRGLLDRELPRVLAGPNCRTEIFSSRCKLVKATFEKTGTYLSAAGCVLDIATLADDAANIFVYGTIEIGSGATWEQRGIIASEPIEGGQRITVDWPVRQAPVGQAVKFSRGCDRTAPTCTALGNFENFRGIPNMPQTNLVLPTMALPNAPAKK